MVEPARSKSIPRQTRSSRGCKGIHSSQTASRHLFTLERINCSRPNCRVIIQLFRHFLQMPSPPFPFSAKAPCKRTQHYWPTAPNIVGCYMLHPFANPVACCCLLGVVAQSLKPVKRLSQHLIKFLLFRDLRSVAQQSKSQRCKELMNPFARSLIVLTVINCHEQVLFVLLFSGLRCS